VVPPAFVAGLVAAYVATMFSLLFDQGCIRWAQASKVPVPPSLLLSFLDLVFVILALTIWSTPTVVAVGFALRMHKSEVGQWILSPALLLGSIYVWARHPLGLATLSHVTAVIAGAFLFFGVVMSFLRRDRVRMHFLSNAVAFLIMTLPWCAALAESPKQPLKARRLWSIVLQKGTWQAMNTSSSFGATRQVVFSGDRVVAIFDAGLPRYAGKQPVSTYRLLSIDLKTGRVDNARELTGPWGNMPYLFATNDGHVIFEQGSLKTLNPDLSDAGPRLNVDRGRVVEMSPDGSTLAWEKNPGTVLLDSHTLRPVGKPLQESVPKSVSAFAGVVTDDTSWYRDYPNDRTFIGLTDEHGLRLLFHGDCGGPPQFVNNETVLLVGCGKMRTIDVRGTILKVAAVSGSANFAGTSQNGERFALEFSDERGDPSILLYEYFVVFDSGNLEPVAMVQLSELPERQSWSALSADGRYFAAGDPEDLSLFQLP